MRVGIYTNVLKDRGCETTKKIVGLLKERGADFCVHNAISGYFAGADAFGEDSPGGFDFLITVGGDGTILRIAEFCARTDTPIVGVNLGQLGFLTEADPAELDKLIDAIKGKRYGLQKRMMLKIGAGGREYSALNELAVCRDDNGRMITLNVYVDGSFVDKFYCDGYIVATPTGSTAYSLSAGGPIISPSAGVLALTPVNSHSLHSRPVVIGENESVRVELAENSESACVLADGTQVARLKGGQSALASRARKSASFVTLGGADFYLRLLSKLNYWSTTHHTGS
ncbi:MAG: NAD(+)/NADH kinase [Clostridiales bacterium]|jgi:NAD+ kinase|nr:NAD(+)/NADH kinase [Clostridiales bacterium]